MTKTTTNITLGIATITAVAIAAAASVPASAQTHAKPLQPVKQTFTTPTTAAQTNALDENISFKVIQIETQQQPAAAAAESNEKVHTTVIGTTEEEVAATPAAAKPSVAPTTTAAPRSQEYAPVEEPITSTYTLTITPEQESTPAETCEPLEIITKQNKNDTINALTGFSTIEQSGRIEITYLLEGLQVSHYTSLPIQCDYLLESLVWPQSAHS